MSKHILAKIPAREWKGLVPVCEGGRLRIPLVCHQCGETDHWSAANMVGPQTAIPKIIQIGWGVDGKLTCPACVVLRKRKHLKIVGDNTVAEKVSPMIKAVEQAFPNASEAARENKKLVWLDLLDCFDGKLGCYREGYTDKSVADKYSVAEAVVKNIREEFYGPLKPPSEVEALLGEIRGMQQGLDGLKKRIEAVIIKQGWKS